MKFQNIEIVKNMNRCFSVPILGQTFEKLYVPFLKLFTKLPHLNKSLKIRRQIRKSQNLEVVKCLNTQVFCPYLRSIVWKTSYSIFEAVYKIASSEYVVKNSLSKFEIPKSRGREIF